MGCQAGGADKEAHTYVRICVYVYVCTYVYDSQAGLARLATSKRCWFCRKDCFCYCCYCNSRLFFLFFSFLFFSFLFFKRRRRRRRLYIFKKAPPPPHPGFCFVDRLRCCCCCCFCCWQLTVDQVRAAMAKSWQLRAELFGHSSDVSWLPSFVWLVTTQRHGAPR